MEANLNWFIRFWSMFILLSLALSPSVYASESLTNLLTNDIFLSDQSAVFVMQKSHAESIVAMQIFYLKSNDCQSGYAGVYDTPKQSPVFPILTMSPFGLRASSVYLAGVTAIGLTQIEQVNSILIRLLGKDRHFAQFIGSCNDQKINCCVPVDCSASAGTCLAKQVMVTQAFMLS